MNNQMSIFDTDLQLNTVMNCGNRICRKCEHWERYDCPVAKKREGEDPYGVMSHESWHKNICSGCMRAIPLPGTLCHDGNHWDHYIEHRYFCESYMKSTVRTEECLGCQITVYDSDGYKWCPLVDSIGCETCYKEFIERIEESEEMENDG